MLYSVKDHSPKNIMVSVPGTLLMISLGTSKVTELLISAHS